MDATTLLPVLGVWTVAVITPGPDFLIVLRSAAGRSLRSGLWVAAGVASGIAVWTVAALLGVVVLLERFEWLYTSVRIAGALFLIGLGLATLWATRRPAAPDATGSAEDGGEDGAQVGAAGSPPPRSGAWRAGVREWRLGVLTNLANPKALVFFGALFAGMLPRGTGALDQAAVIGGMVAISFGWFAVVAALASAPYFSRLYRSARRTLDRIVGGLFVGIGGALIPR